MNNIKFDDNLNLEKAIKDGIDTFPYFRPSNQLPYPGTKGCLLVTSSDFTLPPRIDLLKWQTIESIIGVYNIEASIEDNILSLYKTVNNEKTKVFEIGVITVEDKEKLNKLSYINYLMTYDNDNHILKFSGVDKDYNITTIFEKDIVDYITFTNTINNLNNLINGLRNDVDTINNDITNINQNLLDLNNFKSQYLEFLQIISQATNPSMVLVKDVDGVRIKWENRHGLDDVVAELDAINNTISFYKIINGVRSLIYSIDNFNYADYLQFKQNFQYIANNLNESTTPNFILAKVDNTTYDWININDIIKFSCRIELIDNKYYNFELKMFNQTYSINYYDKTQIDNILNNYYTKNETNNLLNQKLSLSNIVELTYNEYVNLDDKDQNTYYIITDRI